jgi:2-keto-4-pentenoate hydratase/2-oxohepta-3-ene-1,7-dioic acid hydratase in catechol pathway
MKLVTFKTSEKVARIGVLLDDVVVDILSAAQTSQSSFANNYGDMISLMEAGPLALDEVRRLTDWAIANSEEAILRLEAVQLLAPVPQPTQMRDFLCFEKHLRQARECRYQILADQTDDPAAAMTGYREKGMIDPPPVWYDQPIYYCGNRLCVIGTGEDVIWPFFAEKMDYELEFGVYVGKSGRNISKKDAATHIFGYTIFNDISARDTQIYEMTGQLGPGKGKDFDTANVMGPCLVTADEIKDPYDLVMTARVNGIEYSRGNSGEMHHNFEDIIEYISRSTSIYVGEFFGSGTVGSGCGLEYNRFLKPGDFMELEIDQIGILSNRIVKTQQAKHNQIKSF